MYVYVLLCIKLHTIYYYTHKNVYINGKQAKIPSDAQEKPHTNTIKPSHIQSLSKIFSSKIQLMTYTIGYKRGTKRKTFTLMKSQQRKRVCGKALHCVWMNENYFDRAGKCKIQTGYIV